MLRTLLVGILAVTAAAACSSKGEAPAAQPGVAAGKVLELTGTVTATRGTQVRTLAAGGEISSDDVIDTAAESRVVILVAHNNARWDLGPNKHGKVGESLAWTAAKQDRPAAAVIEESSTAGAHAEKTAATTGTTTAEPTKERAEPKPADKGAASRAPEPAPIDDLQTKGDNAGPGAAAPAAGLPSPPPPPPPPPPRAEPQRRKAETASAPRPLAQAMQNEESKTPAPIEVQEQLKKGSIAGAPENTIAPRDVGATRTGGAGAGSGSAVDPVRQLQREIHGTFTKGRTAMRACFEPTAPNVMIQITVTKGIYTITTVDRAATDKARACLATIAKGLSSTTKLDKPVYITLTLVKP